MGDTGDALVIIRNHGEEASADRTGHCGPLEAHDEDDEPDRRVGKQRGADVSPSMHDSV